MANTETVSDTNNILYESKDYLKFCDKTDAFYKELEFLKSIIQTRGEIFSQKKEKYQHLLDFQKNKIERQKEQCMKKSKELCTKIEDHQAHLTFLNLNFDNLKLQQSEEQQLNKNLNNKISELQKDLEKEEEKFRNASNNYTTCITWYENFLKLLLDIEPDNQSISVYFKVCENVEAHPYITIKILNGGFFRVEKFHSSIDEKFIVSEVLEKTELLLLLNNIHQQFCNKSSHD